MPDDRATLWRSWPLCVQNRAYLRLGVTNGYSDLNSSDRSVALVCLGRRNILAAHRQGTREAI